MQDIVRGIVISILLFAISISLPIIGFIFALFIPLPILYYRVKLGRSGAIKLAALVAVGMIVLLGQLGFDILFFVTLIVAGFCLGDLYEKKLTVEKTIGYTCGIVVLSIVTGLIFYSVVSHTGIGVMMTAYVKKNLELTMVLYENMGMSEENIHELSQAMEQVQYVLVRLLPALTIMSTLFVVWINFLASKPLLTSRQLPFPDLGDLKLWRAPEMLIWGVIGCGAVLLIPEKSMKLIGLNGLLVLLTIYFFQGMAIVSFFFQKKNIPKGLRFFFYGLIAIQQLVLLVIIGIGVFDVWLNLRKLDVTDTT